MAETAQDTTQDGTANDNDKGNGNGKRKRLLIAIVGVFAIGMIGWGAYWALVGQYRESTDDAYVDGNIVQVTSQVAGTVLKIGAGDTDFVRAGTTLVQLDTADAKVALDEAESALAKTVRQVRNLFETSAQLEDAVRQRGTDLSRAQEDLRRRERLSASGAVSGEELQHARDAVRSAEAALSAAKRQLAAQHALVDHTTIDDHPDVKSAAARVRQAYLTYSRTSLPAPVSGYVAKRTVQLGQRISAGAPLMAIVPLDDVWVEANFKEGQLRNMRVGQPVELTADLYGGKLAYHGKVIGFGAGTGGAFALLPAQNASGNWIKIVQRVPVRIALDAKDLEEHPLQVGLSMQVKVDTHDRSGARLPRMAPGHVADASAVFDVLDREAEARVQSIIAANDGRPAPRVARGRARSYAAHAAH
jgi:membrane fusion protein (multidrug efflux system)